MPVRLLLLVPLVLVPALAVLVLRTQLSLKLAEALYLATVCLHQPQSILNRVFPMRTIL